MQTASRTATSTKKTSTLKKSGKPKSRSSQLLNHLIKGRTISGTQALRTFGIYRLSAVIHGFRKKGMKIETKMITRKGRTYGVYKFIEEKAK